MLGIDRTLLDRCIAKEVPAQFALYRLLHDTLMSVARRYERDHQKRMAMVNLAFLKILDHLDTWQPIAPFEAWCYRIMVNVVLKEQRRDRALDGYLVPVMLDEAMEASTNQLDGSEEMVEEETLQEMLDKLPLMARQVFNLHVIDGWKHREIAEELGISEGTSKWHVNHARKLLQRMVVSAARTERTNEKHDGQRTAR